MRGYIHDSPRYRAPSLLSGVCVLSTLFFRPLFGNDIGAITMKDGEIKESSLIKQENRRLEESPVGSILTPPIVVVIHGLPGYFISVHRKAFPLDTGVEHEEDIVDDLVVGYLRFRSFLWTPEMWFDELIEIILRYFDREFFQGVLFECLFLWYHR